MPFKKDNLGWKDISNEGKTAQTYLSLLLAQGNERRMLVTKSLLSSAAKRIHMHTECNLGSCKMSLCCMHNIICKGEGKVRVLSLDSKLVLTTSQVYIHNICLFCCAKNVVTIILLD